MSKYRKKPVVIDAIKYTGENHGHIFNWMLRKSFGDPPCARGTTGGELIIETLEGDFQASPGDFIICGVKGEFCPCKPDIFEATYEPA